MQKADIDGGMGFDWGRTSEDYARYRDIYPPEFYAQIRALGLCGPGRRVLDIGTGTGVLPRAMAAGGARFTGVDISPQQVEQARRLSREAGLDIEYLAVPAEELPFEADSFDDVTACQCFHYFDPAVLLPVLGRVLAPGGLLGIFFLNWLPHEDPLAGATEELVLKYNPGWTGRGYQRVATPPAGEPGHGFAHRESALMDLELPFTRDSWNGRIRACRGVGASLPPDRVAAFEKEHLALLKAMVPESFTVRHQAVFTVLENTK